MVRAHPSSPGCCLLIASYHLPNVSSLHQQGIILWRLLLRTVLWADWQGLLLQGTAGDTGECYKQVGYAPHGTVKENTGVLNSKGYFSRVLPGTVLWAEAILSQVVPLGTANNIADSLSTGHRVIALPAMDTSGRYRFLSVRPSG